MAKGMKAPNVTKIPKAAKPLKEKRTQAIGVANRIKSPPAMKTKKG